MFPTMWMRTNPKRTMPVTATSTFLVTEASRGLTLAMDVTIGTALILGGVLAGEKAAQLLDGVGRLLQSGCLIGRQLQLDDPLEAAGPEHHRDAHVEALDPVLAFEERGARENLLLVLEDRVDHLDRGGRGRVIGRAGLEEVDDLGTAAGGP